MKNIHGLMTSRNVNVSRSIEFFGPPRSGNHAIINWLMRNFPEENKIFFNNCRPQTDPFVTCSQAEFNLKNYSKKEIQEFIRKSKILNKSNNAIIVSYEKEFIGNRRGKNRFLKLLNEDPSNIDKTKIHKFVLIRGIMNWIASLQKLFMTHSPNKLSNVDVVSSIMENISDYSTLLDLACSGDLEKKIHADKI